MEHTTQRDSLKSPFPLARWLLVAVGTALSGLPAGWALHAGGQMISPLWIPAGVSVAFFICDGWRAAPAVVTGHLALGLVIAPDRPIWATLGLAVIFTAEA